MWRKQTIFWSHFILINTGGKRSASIFLNVLVISPYWSNPSLCSASVTKAEAVTTAKVNTDQTCHSQEAQQKKREKNNVIHEIGPGPQLKCFVRTVRLRASKTQVDFTNVPTCCSRCSWKGWGPPVNGWSDCPPGSPCCSCYWPPRRWWLLHLCGQEPQIRHSREHLNQVEKARARRHKAQIPLKHWIHFLRSSLWPPTSNILSDNNTKRYNTVVSAITFPNGVFTHWKFTLSTWNLVSKIPEVSTLQRSKS